MCNKMYCITNNLVNVLNRKSKYFNHKQAPAELEFLKDGNFSTCFQTNCCTLKLQDLCCLCMQDISLLPIFQQTCDV